MSSSEVDPDGSRMLDSIKATLTRVLGPESAQVVEFYVDKHLALKDPVAFEKALADFLGSQAGRLLIDAIRSDLRSEVKNLGRGGPVSRFLKESSAPPLQARGVRRAPPNASVKRQASQAGGVYQDRLLKAVKEASDERTPFRSLATEYLVESQGPTCAYATIACLGRKAIDDPVIFAQKATATFGLEGAVLLDGLTAFCERRMSAHQPLSL